MSNTFFKMEFKAPIDAKCKSMSINLTKAVREKGLIMSVRGDGLFEDESFASIELDKTEAKMLSQALKAFINNEISATH